MQKRNKLGDSRLYFSGVWSWCDGMRALSRYAELLRCMNLTKYKDRQNKRTFQALRRHGVIQPAQIITVVGFDATSRR
jgi:hypothetical protein